MAIASLKAGETISAGDAVFVSSTGLVFKAVAQSQDNASVAGIAANGGSSGDLIRINLDGIYTSTDTFNVAERLYLDPIASGAYRNYDAVASGLALTSLAGAYATEIGTAVTTNKINIEISLPRFITNPVSVLLLESSAGLTIDAILQEDGSTIKTESAT